MLDLLDGPKADTVADRAAAMRWTLNHAALVRTQPRLASLLANIPVEINWIFGRDGSLTGRNAHGWISGCSLPLRAAEAMLRRLTLEGVVACFLSPVHGAQLRAALDKLDSSQAVIALIPEPRDLRIALGCFDFSDDLRAHRLWFASDDNWETNLASLLAEQPGLPTPSEFIRTPATPEETTAPLIPAAQRVISQVLSERTRQAAALSQAQSGKAAAPRCRLGVVAGSRFRLWNNASAALARVLAGASPERCQRLDVDDPVCASGLAIAQLATECDAIVTPNLSRSHLGPLVPASVALITWLTTPDIPAYDARMPDDALLLADAAWLPAARRAGWPDSRLAVAGWPEGERIPSNVPPHSLAFIADARSLDTPTVELGLSSHHLLWESIREELTRDPFQLEADVDLYLSERRRKLGISEDGFNRAFFVDRLLLPAYQQGLARTLVAAGLPVQFFGKGWDKLPEFRGAWGGLVRTPEELSAAAANSTLLVHLWPWEHAHEMDTLGKPVLRRRGRPYHAIISEARSLNGLSPRPAGPRLSEEGIRCMIAA